MKEKYIIGIDDTDNLESRGTGSIASEMCEIIRREGYGSCDFITRHQLFLHPDIAYTSHNSSMIFGAVIDPVMEERMTRRLCAYLKQESAPGSDPGLCIARIGTLKAQKELIQYSLLARQKVLTKAQAYAIAEKCNVFLEELGGEGIGVIGALAGVGLRLSGNDGELKGGVPGFAEGCFVSVEELLRSPFISMVCDEKRKEMSSEEKVFIKWKVKPVLSQGQLVLLAEKDEAGQWISLDKKELRLFGARRADLTPCRFFAFDVSEENISEENNCFNCRYRRWTDLSFSCMKKER